MRRIICQIILATASAAAASAAQDGPTSSVRIEAAPTETTVDLNAKGRPLAEVLDELARKMGYAKVYTKVQLDGQKIDSKFDGKPAWECMTAILKENTLTFGGGEIGQDYSLTLYADDGSRNVFRVSGGLVARFNQSTAGSVRRTPRDRPCYLEIRGEPRIGWSLKRAEVTDQKNAQGKPADLLGIDIFNGRPQMRFGKDPTSPWPGLSHFAVKGEAEFVTKKIVADTSGLSLPEGSHSVEHEGEALFKLEEIRSEGRFVDFRMSFASSVKAKSVTQGGWGFPVEDRLEQEAGVRFELLGEDGNCVSPAVLVLEGDGTRAVATLRIPPHKLDNAGGIGKATLRFSKPIEKETREISFEFDLQK